MKNLAALIFFEYKLITRKLHFANLDVYEWMNNIITNFLSVLKPLFLYRFQVPTTYFNDFRIFGAREWTWHSENNYLRNILAITYLISPLDNPYDDSKKVLTRPSIVLPLLPNLSSSFDSFSRNCSRNIFEKLHQQLEIELPNPIFQCYIKFMPFR